MSIVQVQVYEKTDEETIGGSQDKIRVLDLKLKDEAKKGRRKRPQKEECGFLKNLHLIKAMVKSSPWIFLEQNYSIS